MSRIDDLISELCPEGVEVKSLATVAEIANNGVDKKSRNGEQKVWLVNFVDVFNNVEIRSSHLTMQATASERQVESCSLEKGDLLITPTSESKDELARAAVVAEPLPNAVYSYHVMRIRVRDSSALDPKFLLHLFASSALQYQIKLAAQGITRFGLTQGKWNDLKLPLPPLEAQREIVRILDQFTALEAELEAELGARRKQYEHVRQELLTLSQGAGVRFEKIGDLCTLVRGVELSLEDRKVGDYPLVTAGKTELARHNAFNYEKHSVTVTSHGAYAGFVNYWPNPIWLGNNVFLLEPAECLEVKFLFYSMKSREPSIQSRAKGGGVPYMNWKDITSIEIAVPKIDTQRQIVRTLDHFTELLMELEAELLSRRDQHRYYLDKLLTFPEVATP